jgi:mannosyltransferase
MATQTEAPRVRPAWSAGQGARDGRWLDVAVVAGPAVVAIVLCLYELTARSLWLDEAATVAIASQHGSALWSAMAHDGGNMLGYYALEHVLVGWFGTGAFAIRLPSVVSAGACAGVVAFLALGLFDRRVALIAGLLTAVSLPLVFWGQDARGYAPMMALVAGSFAAFSEVVQGPRRRSPWIAYVACTVLSVYASYVAILALPAQLLVLGRRRDAPWRRVACALAVCVVCWIPLAVLAATRGSGQLFWIPRPGLTTEKQVVLALTSAGFEPNFHPTWAATTLAIVTVALIVFAATRALRRGAPWGAVLALSWLVVPVVLIWLESLVGQSIFTARNLLVSLPAVALLVGWVIAQSRLVWAALVVLLALRVGALAPSYGTSPENWKAATAFVVRGERPGDCVVFYPQDAQMPFAYYTGRPLKPYIERYVTPRVPSGCARVWLVVSHQGLPTGPATSRAHYSQYVALRKQLAHRYARSVTRSFGYASVIWVELFYGRSVVPTNVSALRTTSSTPFTHSRAVKARPRT